MEKYAVYTYKLNNGIELFTITGILFKPEPVRFVIPFKMNELSNNNNYTPIPKLIRKKVIDYCNDDEISIFEL
jgi:hypothetical protein